MCSHIFYRNRYYLLSKKTTVIVLVHFWVALIVICCFPVLNKGSDYKHRVSKCAYEGMGEGDSKQIKW